MAEEPDRSTRIASLTSAKPQPAQFRYIWPAIVGLVVIVAAGAGYLFWSRAHDQQLAETVGDAGLDRPLPAECAIAKVAMHAVHAAGDDARWQAAVGAVAMTLKPQSRVVNPVDVAGFSDDEADNLRDKTVADWRWCEGMGGFVRGLGWTPMGSDAAIAQLGLSRPGVNAAGDEAKVYQTFTAPPSQGDSDAPRPKRGPWLITLHRGTNGAWQVTTTTDLSAGGS